MGAPSCSTGARRAGPQVVTRAFLAKFLSLTKTSALVIIIVVYLSYVSVAGTLAVQLRSLCAICLCTRGLRAPVPSPWLSEQLPWESLLAVPTECQQRR